MADKEGLFSKVIFGIAAGAASFTGYSIIDNIKTDYEQTVRIEVNHESIQQLNAKVDEALNLLIETSVTTKQTQKDVQTVKEKLNDESSNRRTP